MDKYQLLRRHRQSNGYKAFTELGAGLVPESLASQRQFEVAHWSDTLLDTSVQAAQASVRGFWQGCLFGSLCGQVGACELIMRRACAIDKSKYARERSGA